MTLFDKLKLAKSEEDVKDIYIKALGLKGYSKNLIDIQTKEIWFEAKDSYKISTYAMFTQLLHYVQQALNKGEYVPPFLAVVDTQKAAIMKSSDVIPFLAKKTIKWGKKASGYTQEALDTVSAYIGTYLVSFRIETQEEEVHAPDRFECDFMVQYMRGKTFSKEAKEVLQTGKALWQAYFADTDVHTVRDELKLNRPDVGWYQVRKALQARNKSGDFTPVSFKAFEEAYKTLTEKVQPMVYELGFLKA
jgi:hypothetical protein